MNARLILGSLLLAATTSLMAQAPAAGTQAGPAPDGQRKGGHHMRDCAKSEDPAKCEARRKEMREHMQKSREACKGKEGSDRGACMAKEMCAKAPDPAQCETRAKERAEKRKDRHEHGAKERKERRATDTAPKS